MIRARFDVCVVSVCECNFSFSDSIFEYENIRKNIMWSVCILEVILWGIYNIISWHKSWVLWFSEYFRTLNFGDNFIIMYVGL